MSAPTAGWYPDVTKPGTQRYWDGQNWTEHHAPLATAPEKPERVAGWVMAVGLLLGIFFPIGGVVVGLSQIGKKDCGQIFAASLVGAVIWYFLLSN